MDYLKKNQKTAQAFSSIEILLSLLLFMVLVLGLSSSISFGLQQQRVVSEENKASFLLEEGVEALTNIRDSGFTQLVAGSYGLSLSGGSWSLSVNPENIDGFTRSITITVVDQYTRDAEVAVSWQSNIGAIKTLNAVSRLTDWRRLVAPPGNSWQLPQLLSGNDLSGINLQARILSYSDNVALIANTHSSSQDLYFVDISDPAAPQYLTTLNIQGTIQDTVVSGDYLYLASDANKKELQVLDLNSRQIVNTLDLSSNGLTNELFVSGNYLYLAQDSRPNRPQFLIYSLTDPALPAFSGSLSFPKGVDLKKLIIHGNYAFLGSNAVNGELIVADVSNPASPQFSVSLDLTGSVTVSDLALLGNLLNLAVEGATNVQVVNIANPLLPTVISSFNAGGVVNALSSGPSLLFLAAEDPLAEFQVWDLNNPNAPVLYGSFDSSFSIYSLQYLPGLDLAIAGGADTSQEFLIFAPY